MATLRLNRRGSTLRDLEQRGLDVDCAELSRISTTEDLLSSRSSDSSTLREEEEGKLASKRQAAIDARMRSVSGALVFRWEESSVLVPESLLTAAHLFASIVNTAGSVCYWAGLYSPGSALFNVGCSLASAVTFVDLARVSHESFESQFTFDRFHAEGSLANTRKQKLVRQEQENAMIALRMFIVAPLCYNVGIIGYYDEVKVPDSLLLGASLLFVAGSYALIVGCLPDSNPTPHPLTPNPYNPTVTSSARSTLLPKSNPDPNPNPDPDPNPRCLSNSMISDQSTSFFMLRSNAVIQQVTLLSCSFFLVSSILFLPIFNDHAVETLLIPFEYPSNVDKYPSNIGSLGFAIGGGLAVVNSLFSEWAKRHETQRANRESAKLLAMLPPDTQNMVSDWHARVAKRMERNRRKTPAALSSSKGGNNRLPFGALISMVRARKYRNPRKSSRSDSPGTTSSTVGAAVAVASVASSSSDAETRDAPPEAIFAAQTWLAKAEGAAR
jgi:hypothetical protein